MSDIAASANLLGDSDDWDDTELIAAYEDATRMARQLALGDAGNACGSSGQGRRRPKQAKKKRLGWHDGIAEASEQPSDAGPEKPPPDSELEPEPEPTRWQVGAPCCAVWSEDGQVYRARILEMGADRRTCLVEYVDYGNTEWQRLLDLMPPVEPEVEDPVDAASAAASATPTPLPPPPVPRLPPGAAAVMDDATYNMLMSWYMSGYYTGYYVGVRAAAAAPSVPEGYGPGLL